jgi:hypothetical protein
MAYVKAFFILRRVTMLRALLIMTMALGLTGITSTLVQASDPIPQCLPCPPLPGDRDAGN